MMLTETFTDFTPSWSAGDVSITGDVVYALDANALMDGTLRGRHRRTSGGYEFAILFSPGPQTIWGSAPSIFEPPSLVRPGASIWFVVPAIAYDLSADRWWTGVGRCIAQPQSGDPPLVSITCHFGANGMPMDATTPFTWAQGDVLVVGNAVEAMVI